jgi:hypothetical protein
MIWQKAVPQVERKVSKYVPTRKYTSKEYRAFQQGLEFLNECSSHMGNILMGSSFTVCIPLLEYVSEKLTGFLNEAGESFEVVALASNIIALERLHAGNNKEIEGNFYKISGLCFSIASGLFRVLAWVVRVGLPLAVQWVGRLLFIGALISLVHSLINLADQIKNNKPKFTIFKEMLGIGLTTTTIYLFFYTASILNAPIFVLSTLIFALSFYEPKEDPQEAKA